jgi:two-component system response regulator ResD
VMARVKAVLRRSAAPDQAEPVTTLAGPGGLSLEVERREAHIQSTLLELSRLEFDLLHSLLLHAGRVLSREQLLEQVWGYDYPGDARTVDTTVKRLRAKLRAVDSQADSILAVRGVGYKLSREGER